MAYRILTINPGSTSTKVAVFDDEVAIFSESISHAADELGQYPEIVDQMPYRSHLIQKTLQAHGVDVSTLSAVVGRGGGLLAVEGGVYQIDEVLLDHAKRGANGVSHPAQLGALLAHDLAAAHQIPGFVVNPPDTDELEPVARLTGVKGIYRNVHLHALNLKQTAITHAKKLEKPYEDCNFVVCHIGGGVSISAHQKGRMIDGNDIVGGEGPMAPTRCGAVPVSEMIAYCYSGVEERDARALCTRTGGFVSHLGTSDAVQVLERAQAGDAQAKLVWDAFLYQIIKEIGAMAAVLEGQLDGILLGGGIAHSKELVETVTSRCSWIAPVTAYPGEFEMEAMAEGAIRALNGEEQVKTYTGVPVWSPEDWQ